ncbi:oxepin-CoA hydrolase, alternative type [Palleronia abyssalis]|uniref:1,2-epoxyphenylacetyl-CoA isomerase n=1 Tax=Palleronia abyssalis TaxID=1501240 RepID=A0A2R8BR60_9RHOB|nr:enoyl-CoA hydratase family protein [Palleronia abyssalis]SPJ22608.1 1,2-epoxyphenylacetyl-CoA isomerase [Palleronia abyssalis]
MTARIETDHHALIVWNENTNRRNALTPAFYDAIQEGCARAEGEAGIGAVIIAGAGGYFSAGGDLNALKTRAELPKRERAEKIERLHDAIRAVRHCPVPVIAAVEGGAAGAGWSIAAACDMIVAARGVEFRAAYVRAGLVPDGGLTATLAATLPPATVLPLLLSGEPITSDRLHALGAVSELCETGEAVARAAVLANAFAHGPREAQTRIKRLAHAAYEGTLAAQLDAERDAMARAQGGPEAAEGIDAFLSKRKPDYERFRK